MKYKESEKIIEKIHRRDEMLFRMAVSHLIDVGMRNLSDEDVNETCEEIMKQDDSKLFMTNEYQCDIVRTAAELAKINHIDLLIYISKYVKYSEI